MFTREQAGAYLAAMIDGEGWVGEPKGVQNRAIRITNCDPVLIEAIQECCVILDIHYTLTSQAARKCNWSDQQTVHIGGLAAFETILAIVPVRAPVKLDRIRRTIPTYRRPLDEDELRRLYASGMTQREVADALGVSQKRVIHAMKAYGIPRRTGTDRAVSIWRSRRANLFG